MNLHETGNFSFAADEILRKKLNTCSNVNEFLNFFFLHFPGGETLIYFEIHAIS